MVWMKVCPAKHRGCEAPEQKNRQPRCLQRICRTPGKMSNAEHTGSIVESGLARANTLPKTLG